MQIILPMHMFNHMEVYHTASLCSICFVNSLLVEKYVVFFDILVIFVIHL